MKLKTILVHDLFVKCMYVCNDLLIFSEELNFCY